MLICIASIYRVSGQQLELVVFVTVQVKAAVLSE